MVASLAALGATAAFAAPMSIGHYSPAPNRNVQLQIVADPVEGAWLWYPGPGGTQLRRIREDGSVATVSLPPKLRAGNSLTFMVFPNGWALAMSGVTIARRGRCHENDPFGARVCDSLVVAQRSPAGGWTRAQAVSIPGSESYGQEAAALSGHVQLAWEETNRAEEGKRVRLASAPLGRPFGAARLLPPLPGRRLDSEVAEPIARHGHLYLTSRIGERLIESMIGGSGRLGGLHRLRGAAVDGSFATPLSEPNGSEVWAYEGGGPENEELLIALRAPGASRLGAPQRVALFTEAGFEIARSANGLALLSVRTDIRAPHSRLTFEEPSRITAAVISSTGKLAPPQIAAFDPNVTSGSYAWTGAIDDRGDQLVLTANEEARRLWASVASSRCPVYSPRFELSADAGLFVASAGRRDVFHVVWVDPKHELQFTKGRIACQPATP